MKARAITAVLLIAPGAVLAHASERAVILTLPTGPYILGAGLAVAVTALTAVTGQRLPDFAAVTLFTRPMLPEGLTSWLAAVALAALLFAGFHGSHDPLENPLPLMVWTVIWVGLTLATALFGNLWRDLNPWGGPVRAARTVLHRTGGIGLARFGAWPAVAGYLGFVWYQIISPAPDDPARLALVVAGYWLVIFVLAVAEGEGWLDQGEFLCLFFGLIACIAPFWAERRDRRAQVMAGWPGAQILRAEPLGASAAAFVTLLLASVSFDGLHETFWWLARIGINPLEFPGRTAVMAANTLGLLAVWVAMSGLIWAVTRQNPGPLMLSFLPIAAGYHIAHYLVALLTQGQYALAAVNDPFETGQRLLGLPEHWVSFGFLSQADSVRHIWQAQVAIILGAHLLAVLLAEKLARNSHADAAPARKIPLTILMVLYTIFGLWLLAAPTIG